MGVIKKIVHCLACITYVLIFIYLIVSIPIIFKYKPVVVLSGSMDPTFKTGSIIYYKWIEPKLLKKDDIITFNNQGKNYVSHRIIDIDDDGITTKGDANEIADRQKVRFENIRGKVTNITIPYVGYFIRIANKNSVIIIITAIIILISEFLMSNLKRFNKDKENYKIEEEIL